MLTVLQELCYGTATAPLCACLDLLILYADLFQFKLIANLGHISVFVHAEDF